MEKKGYIYILTNPSFPQYVKIGYADDVEKRVKQLNRSECTPFAFRLYATYEVSARLTDVYIHSLIDRLNPTLRSIDDFNGKKRVREFYAMKKEDAYSIFESITRLDGTEEKLRLYQPTEEDIKSEEAATEIRLKKPASKLPKMDWLIEQGLVSAGDKIYVISHPDEVAVVSDAEHVTYKGKKVSFNQFGCQVTGWKAIQCYAMMRKVGDSNTLADLREERMRELGMIG